MTDTDGLRRALAEAEPGTTIRIAPGTYRGGLSARGLRGEPGSADQSWRRPTPSGPPSSGGATPACTCPTSPTSSCTTWSWSGATGQRDQHRRRRLLRHAGPPRRPAGAGRPGHRADGQPGRHQALGRGRLPGRGLHRRAVGRPGLGDRHGGLPPGRGHRLHLPARRPAGRQRRPGQGGQQRDRDPPLPVRARRAAGGEPRRQHRPGLLPARARRATRRRTSRSRTARSSAR